MLSLPSQNSVLPPAVNPKIEPQIAARTESQPVPAEPIAIDPQVPVAIVPPSALKLEPHVQPQTRVAGWIWTLFVSSVLLFTGTTLFVNFTRTEAILLPQPPLLSR
jgi:hypothetical protein